MSGFFFVLFISFVLVTLTGAAQPWSTTPFNAPALPLAVRSPYLNSWLIQGNNPKASGASWPNLWTGSHITGWSALVQVDNQTYAILGDAPVTNVANEIATEFTATRTSFLFQAGPVVVNASFLSPMEPTDLVRQSMPFSYFYINVSSSDGQPHHVQVYSDISGEWITGNTGLLANWTQTITSDFISLQTQLQNPARFTEIADSPHDAVVYYSMQNQSGISWQIGQDIVVRGQFNSSGTLTDQADDNFRAVGLNFTVLALSVDLGQIVQTSSPVVWSIGLLRDPVIQYTGSSGETEFRSSYFWSQYSSVQTVIGDFLDDFDRALGAAIDLDAKIESDGLKYSSEYADILALSARQVLGSTDITLPTSTNGNWNTSDVKSFMKNMGSTTGVNGVNTVDVLYASFPLYLYLNPALGGYLLAPLLEYQESDLYPNPYAAQDLGGPAYPNATGNNSPHNMGIEESANMLIMTLAHAQASGNGTLIGSHYDLLQNWADYLVSNALSPDSQVTADGFTETNQTNLAIKGIIGIGAMGRISQIANRSDDSTKYNGISTTYVQQWQTLAMSSDGSHLLAEYGVQSSSGLIYNLYADKLLQLNLVSESIYDAQSAFYAEQLGLDEFGLVIDNSTPDKSRTDWMMFAGGSISNESVRNQFVSQVHSYAASSQNATPFAAIYNPGSGAAFGGVNSPAQGAMFSFLVLNQTNDSDNVNGLPGLDSSPHKSHAGTIAGAIIGSLALLGALIFLAFYLRRRRRDASRKQRYSIDSPESFPAPIAAAVVHPFVVSDEMRSTLSPTSPGGYSNVTYGQLESKSGQRLRQESYYQSHGEGSSTASGPTMSLDGSRRGSLPDPVFVKQTMVQDELRSDVENLRREVERIREEREILNEAAPPSYSPPTNS